MFIFTVVFSCVAQNIKLDYELQSDKAEHLSKELEDLTSLSQDSQELLQLKRQKNELERKVQDQEEELDEQAATIQQLEQVSQQLAIIWVLQLNGRLCDYFGCATYISLASAQEGS